MKSPDNLLLELRREIDRIDKSLHDLIMQRTNVVQRIANIKSRSGVSVMQPGREAEVLRRLIKAHSGSFPVASLVQIWREIIAAVTALQGPHSVAIQEINDEEGYWDLARAHFGSQTPLTTYPSANDVIKEVVSGRTSIGVLPIPSVNETNPWWPSLCLPGAPRIVIRLPFASGDKLRGGSLEAFAIARTELEYTGSDCTILALETNKKVPYAVLSEMLRKSGLHAKFIASQHIVRSLHFAEVAEFITAGDSRLRLIQKSDTIKNIMIIGAYAIPLSTKELQNKTRNHQELGDI